MSDWPLAKLEAALPGCRRRGDASLRRLQIDSREVGEGDLFAALPGLTVDGLDFLDQAA